MRFQPARSIATVAAALLGAIVLGTASFEASSADGPAPNLKACATYNLGYPVAANWSLTLWTWNGSGYTHLRSVKTTVGGCGIFYDVAPNRNYFVKAEWIYEVPYTYSSGRDRMAYVGSTGWLSMPNTQYVTYQTKVVVQGPYHLD